jgi:hypothetical protein
MTNLALIFPYHLTLEHNQWTYNVRIVRGLSRLLNRPKNFAVKSAGTLIDTPDEPRRAASDGYRMVELQHQTGQFQ